MQCDKTLPRPVLPKRIPKKDQRWHKGLFVAANVRHVGGVPLFGQVNSDWVIEAQIKRLCQLCGQHISKDLPAVFPGGPNEYKYEEAPLHIECARYSMLVCPRILSRRDTFTFHVCKTYDVMHLGHTKEGTLIVDGAVPKNLRRGTNLFLSLYMAHPIERQRYTMACGHDHIQRLSFDEFLKWSERW
jgi:hypothetical protein